MDSEKLAIRSGAAPAAAPPRSDEAERSALLTHAVRSALVVDCCGTIRCHSGEARSRLDLGEDCVGASIEVVATRLGFPVDEDVRSVLAGAPSIERLVRGPNGLWLNLRFKRCALGAGPGVVIVVTDATTAHTFEVHTVWGASVVQNCREAIVGVYRDGTIVIWNAGAQTLLGWNRSEIDGRSVLTLIPPENQRDARVLTDAVFKGVRIGPVETELLSKDQERIPVRGSLAPVVDSAGEVLGALLLCECTDQAGDEDMAEIAHSLQSVDSRILDGAAALKLTNASLQRELAERDLLAGRVAHAQDLERRRIGRELHDSVGQYLSALSMNLMQLERGRIPIAESARRLITDSTCLLEQCVKEVRTISYLLHPPALDELGLVMATRWYCDGFSSRSGIRLTLEVGESVERMSPNVELSLFRVLQESLSNIQRHAECTEARVSLQCTGSVVRLEVSDTGCGIPAEQLGRLNGAGGTSGVGIAGMRDRLRQLGGRLTVASDTTGTSVVAVVALEQRDRRHSPGAERSQGWPT